jgi:hypothetical protein
LRPTVHSGKALLGARTVHDTHPLRERVGDKYAPNPVSNA